MERDGEQDSCALTRAHTHNTHTPIWMEGKAHTHPHINIKKERKINTSERDLHTH